MAVVDAEGISTVAKLLSSEGDNDLARAVARCLAHYTNGGDVRIAKQIQGDDGKGVKHVMGLATHDDRGVWEPALACIVNLSHLESFRPTMGDAVTILVDKVRRLQRDSGPLTPQSHSLPLSG